MKVFFDTNVYVAESLNRGAASQLLQRTVRAGWRIYISSHVLDELRVVLEREFHVHPHAARTAQSHALERASLVDPVPSRHEVRTDPDDTPVLNAALDCGADYLVANDRHLLDLHPYEGLQIISMTRYIELLREHGLWT